MKIQLSVTMSTQACMHTYEHNGVSKLNSIILSKEAKQIETFEDFPGIIVGEVFRVQISA